MWRFFFAAREHGERTLEVDGKSKFRYSSLMSFHQRPNIENTLYIYLTPKVHPNLAVSSFGGGCIHICIYIKEGSRHPLARPLSLSSAETPYYLHLRVYARCRVLFHTEPILRRSVPYPLLHHHYIKPTKPPFCLLRHAADKVREMLSPSKKKKKILASTNLLPG